jgi:hypothetical protein
MKNNIYLIHLPSYMIVKCIIIFDTMMTSFYFIANLSQLNEKYLNNRNILSFHPLIIRDGDRFYHLKKVNENDYFLINFCLNIDSDDPTLNNLILENYFNQAIDL